MNRSRIARAESILATGLVLLASLMTSCAAYDEADPPSEAKPGIVGTVEIVARGLEFEAPDEIPPGWTTFRLVNDSAMTHFALVERLPDGYGIEEQQAQVAPVFQDGLTLLLEGKSDAAMTKFGELPAWFGEIVFLGGPGLVSPGHTAEATVFLEPGTYLIECYVKTNGIFHSYSLSPPAYGMVHELIVTGDPTDAPEPRATLHLAVSSERGIVVSEPPRPGEHVVAVHFEDQKVHENFVGHDVHLARLTDETDLDALAAWMDWSLPGGLETPAPVEFIGGTNELPAGTTGYFRVRLDPGRYAWVSEVSNPRAKKMLEVFTVPAPN